MRTAGTSAPSLNFDPSPSDWQNLIRDSCDRSSIRHSRFREQVQLPTNRPIIIAGHQAEPWHTGIFAKFIAADALAKQTNAHVVWLFVDQDSGTPATITLPTRSATNHLRRSTLTLGDEPDADIPLSSRPPFRPHTTHLDHATPQSALEGVHRWITALNQNTQQQDIAHQIAAALRALAAPWCSPDAAIFATQLSRTDAFAEMIDAMRRDPLACVNAYNQAIMHTPEARVAPLRSAPSESQIELPVWVMPDAHNQPRRKANLADLDQLPNHRFAPRALTMTALLRSVGCDLFIHGTGGARYDTITELWIRDWLACDLAPTAVASADLMLDLGACPVTPREIQDAHRLAHKARHDPAILNDVTAASQKQSLLKAIAQKKYLGTNPLLEFQEMQSLLHAYRIRHADQLSILRNDVRNLQSRAQENQVITARDWPFFLHPDEAIDELATRIRAQFTGCRAD